MISIRRTTEEDVPTIVALNSALFQEDAGQRDPYTNLNWSQEEGEPYFTNLMANESTVGFLAESEGEAVGYLVGVVNKQTTIRPVLTADLHSMFIYDAHRRQGTGQQLVNHFLAWAREQGVKRITVSAYATNDPALNFYRKNGFVARSIVLDLRLSP